MEYSEKLKDPRWQKRRLEIMERDLFACQLCTDTETELQIHHKKYTGEPWDAPNEDLVTLCAHCHKAETKANKIEDSIALVYKTDGSYYAKTKKGSLFIGKIHEDKKLFLALQVNKPLELMVVMDTFFKVRK